MTQRSASSEKQIKQAVALAKRDAETRETIIATLMSNSQGRRYLWLELEDALVFHDDTLEVPEMDHATLCVRAGRRSAGLKLLGAISAFAPNQYFTMVKENSGVKLDERNDNDSGDE